MALKSVDLNSPKRTYSLGRHLIRFGAILFIIALLIIGFTFYPVIQEEGRYLLHRTREKVVVVDQEGREYGPDVELLEPANTDFSIVVPKIAASAPIVANVDPNNAYIYQQKLTEGVAHAAGTPLPGEGGNTFLFAHSAGNFYEANRYNAVFYLLTKLETSDVIDVFYKGKKYEYRVTSKQIVDPAAVEYLQNTSHDTITLMTCWPAGTTMKRLIVQGSLSQ